MAADDLDLWRRAIPLSDAVWRFSSPRLRAKLIATRRRARRKRAGSYIQPTDHISVPEMIQEIGDEFKKALDTLRPQIEVDEEMRRILLNEIKKGMLIAVGYAVNNGTVDETPRQVPFVLLDSRFINWQKSSLKGLGREFVSVGVARRGPISGGDTKPRTSFQPVEAQQLKDAAGSGRGTLGRPPRKMIALLELVGRLADENQLEGLLRKQQIALVQSRACQENPRLFPKSPSPNSVLEAFKRTEFLA